MFPRKQLEYNNELYCLRRPGLDLIRRTVGERVEKVVRESVKRRLSKVKLWDIRRIVTKWARKLKTVKSR
jgi:hypothetical protein